VVQNHPSPPHTMTASGKPRPVQAPPDDEHLQNFGLPQPAKPTTTYLNALSHQPQQNLASNRIPLNTTAKMVKLEEVMDEEFVREQDGPHDEDDWDTDSGTYPPR
jgi:hypothetical protein